MKDGRDVQFSSLPSSRAQFGIPIIFQVWVSMLVFLQAPGHVQLGWPLTVSARKALGQERRCNLGMQMSDWQTLGMRWEHLSDSQVAQACKCHSQG